MTVHIGCEGYSSKDLGIEMEALVTAATEASLNSHIIKKEGGCGRAVVWDPRCWNPQSATFEERVFMEKVMFERYEETIPQVEPKTQYIHNYPDGRSVTAEHIPEDSIMAGVWANVRNPLCNRLNI